MILGPLAIEIFGMGVLEDTRCAHYHSGLDVIAIRFRCCERYFACFECHENAADHPGARWSVHEFDRKAILCGVCAAELTISEYLACGFQCPACGAAFNPGCAAHYHLYFEMT